MNILDRYLARALLTGTLLVLMVLVALDAVFALVGELSRVGSGDYDLLTAIEFVLATLPQRTLRVIPTATLLGCLLGLGQLAANSELTVLQAAGVSRRRIVQGILKAGVLIVAAMVAMSEWLVPPSEQFAQELRAAALSKRVSVKGRTGLWVRDGETYINIRQVFPGNILRGITVYRFGDAGLRETVRAESARMRDGLWQLRDLRYSSFRGERVETRVSDHESWPQLVNPDLVKVLAVNPQTMSGTDLYKYVGYLRDNDLDARVYELAFWSKLLNPVSALAMLVIAAPFVFGFQRGGGAGQRLLIGGVIGIGYFLVDRTFGHLALVFDLPLLLTASLPTLLCFAGGFYFLQRAA